MKACFFWSFVQFVCFCLQREKLSRESSLAKKNVSHHQENASPFDTEESFYHTRASLFFRDVSLFHNHTTTKMQSIQSTNSRFAVVEVHKFSLSLFLSSLSSRVLFCLSRPFSLSRAHFFLWKVALRDDDFCDYIFGYLFGLITRETFVLLLTLISFLSPSCTRIPASNVCE